MIVQKATEGKKRQKNPDETWETMVMRMRVIEIARKDRSRISCSLILGQGERERRDEDRERRREGRGTCVTSRGPVTPCSALPLWEIQLDYIARPRSRLLVCTRVARFFSAFHCLFALKSRISFIYSPLAMDSLIPSTIMSRQRRVYHLFIFSHSWLIVRVYSVCARLASERCNRWHDLGTQAFLHRTDENLPCATRRATANDNQWRK